MTSPNTIWKSLTIPPPVMGWNTRDPLVGMDQLYAVDMENYFPGNGRVDMRKGFLKHASIANGIIQSLHSLESQSVSALVTVAQVGGATNTVYNVTAAGAGVDISGGVNLASSACQMHQFRDRLFIKPSTAVGVADVYHWTGVGNIAASGFTGPSADDKNLLAMGSYKNRMYFGQFLVPSIWYGGIDAVTGALTEFPLTSLLTKGPTQIVFVGSATRAKQYAEDDLFCVVTLGGEVLVYQGDYPGSITWSLLGRYTIPAPIGTNACFYSGSDLNIATITGVVSVTKMLSGDYTGAWPTINDNIESAYIEILKYQPLGYVVNQGIAYPKGQYLLVNAYDSIDGVQTIVQLVMNTTTGAWCKFIGQDAEIWALWADNLYFGTEGGIIFKADTGYIDDDGNGNPVNRPCLLRPAYNYFGDPELNKQFQEVIPTIYESQGLNNVINIDVDFSRTDPVTAENSVIDATSNTYKLYQPRVGLTGPTGSAGSVVFKDTVTTKRRSIQAMKVFYTEGDAF